MDSNPIQQRIEEFEQQYLITGKSQKYSILVCRTPQSDVEMIEAFYEYMLGIDNEIDDVVILFQHPLHDEKTYSKELVEELFYHVFLWNYSDKPESIEENHIDWDADYDLGNKKNLASLFVENLNRFCEDVEFEQDSNLVCVLDYQNSESKLILKWLTDFLKLELHPKIKIVLSDTFENPIFNELKNRATNSVCIVPHSFGLNQAFKEIASMGEPGAPDTMYRYHMMQLFEAIGAKKEQEISKQSTRCIEICDLNKRDDANWYIQKMFIYSALSSYEFGKKVYKQSMVYIDKGIEAVKEVVGVLPDDTIFRLLGQGMLFRGNILMLMHKYHKAKHDFEQGEECYRISEDVIMQIEALRLLAIAADKDWDHELKNNSLSIAIRLGEKLNPTLAEASTYKFLVKEVLNSNYLNYISEQELNQILIPLYGDKWRDKTETVKKIVFNKELFE